MNKQGPNGISWTDATWNPVTGCYGPGEGVHVQGQIINAMQEMGRSRYHVRCVCGETVTAFAWSWAGHGFVFCPRCHARICYYCTILGKPACKNADKFASGATGGEGVMAKMLIVQNCSLCGYCRHADGRDWCIASPDQRMPCPALGVRGDCPLPELPDAPDWVAVSKELPPVNVELPMLLEGVSQVIAKTTLSALTGGRMWWTTDSRNIEDTVTHWLRGVPPLPSLLQEQLAAVSSEQAERALEGIVDLLAPLPTEEVSDGTD